MNYRGLSCCLALLALWAQPQAARAAEPCTLKRVAEIAADTSHNALLIKIQIDGHDARVLVDTGSAFNMISPQLAAELKLPLKPVREGAVIDLSGRSIRHMVKVQKVGLGGMTAEDIPFLVLGEDGDKPPPFDGVFGANFLEAYDVEFDLAHDKMNLFLPNECGTEPVYWTRDYDVVPFQIDASMHAVLPVTLEGKSLRAVFDTGASPSVLRLQTARHDFNFDPEANGDKPDGQARGGSGAVLPYYRHRFATFEIGGVAFRNTEFEVITDKVTRMQREHQRHDIHLDSEENMETQVTIGLHHLLRLRAYASFHDRKLYVSAADAK